MNFSYSLKPVLTGIFSVALLVSLAGCDSCKEELPPPPIPEPQVAQVEEDPVDPLAAEKANAEEFGEDQAILTGDAARAVTAAIEALSATPEKPTVTATPKPRAPKAGSIDTSAVSKAFASHQAAMRKCYERALKGSPHLQGKMRLHLVIATTGVAEQVEAQPLSLRDSVVGECMERVARTISFPQPKGGQVEVNKVYAFFPDM